jgi:hypothetical protein
MRMQSKREWRRAISKHGRAIFSSLAGVWAALGKLPVFEGALPAFSDFLVQWTPVAVPLFLLAAFLSARLNDLFGGRTDWDAVDLELDKVRTAVFDNGAPHRLHRVTLFQYRKWTWRKSWWRFGWLMPVSRSSYATQSSSTVWAVPDGRAAEGLAGHCWECNAPKRAFNLPDMCAESRTAADIESYSRRTHCPEKYLRTNAVTARSILAFPVEAKSEKRRLWGVLVLDSADPEIDEARASAQFEKTKVLLGHIL